MTDPTTLARPADGALMSELRALAEAEGVTTPFSPEVLAEVDAWAASPRFDDPGLADLEHLPFVTVDGPHTLDLDQALHVAREGGAYRLRYAIADASFYVPHGSALLADALARGSSFYLPGFNLPMLPRALSEGLVSLNPERARRALVFDVRLDDHATVTAVRVERARIRSRAKLTFDEVEELVADPSGARLARAPFAESLRLFVELGDKRLHHEDRKSIVRYRRVEADVALRADGTLEVRGGERGRVEIATEQVSILSNALGAKLLATGDPEAVQPVYRVHAPPDAVRIASFERLVAAVARERGLPDDPWAYRRAAESGMAGYLESLPTKGPEGRLARALHRQAMLLNGRSVFAAEPGPHYGVGEAVYSRFTAPMREMVGIFCHKEVLERLGAARSRPREEDEALRARVIDAANRARDVQRRLDREIDRRVVRAVLAPDLALPFSQRPERAATVMGVAGSKLHLLLDEPPIDVAALYREQGALLGGAWLEPSHEATRLVVKTTGKEVCRLGDEVRVRAASPDGVVVVASRDQRAKA